MSSHAEAIADRLPTLYSGGDLVRGLAGVLGLQAELIDEQARMIQRAHWFDTTVEIAEAGALGALLDVTPEPWQELDEYRAWFHALRTARLRYGAVTVSAIKAFTELYLASFQQANRMQAATIGDWTAPGERTANQFAENPAEHRAVRLGDVGTEPLLRVTVHHGGLDPAPVGALLSGGRSTESCPVLCNTRTGQALLYLGSIAAGDRLWLRPEPDGAVTAQLNRADVTDRLRGIAQLTPGEPWTATGAPRAITVLPGDNDLWFLPVAHFDEPGVDRALLALADLELTEGRYDTSAFDHALYYQDPGCQVQLAWTQRPPAAFRVDLDGSVLRSPTGHLDAALEARDQLAASMVQGVASLSAAGVRSDVRFRPLYDSQRQLDHLTLIGGRTVREVGTVGIDTLTESGGLFGITTYGDSTYQ